MSESIFQISANHNISVYYTKECNGGGTSFGTKYVEIIKKKYPDKTFNYCLDWCSGPGFIGFNLLAHNICKELHLVDYYQPAIDCAKTSITELPLEFRNNVKVYQIDDLTLLPKTIMFDLVVANPPHFQTEIKPNMAFLNRLYVKNLNEVQKEQLFEKFPVMNDENLIRITVDADWKARKNFYQNIKSHLLPDGTIIMQENAAGSTVDDFASMIDSAGLQITDVFFDDEYNNFMPSIKIYYIEIKHKT